MSKTIRFDHKTLEGGRFHVITSPDVQGLHATGATYAQAERSAMAMVEAILRAGDEHSGARLKSLTYEYAA